MEKLNLIDAFFEAQAERIGITPEQLENIVELATDEELDQILGDDFKPIIDKYLKTN